MPFTITGAGAPSIAAAGSSASAGAGKPACPLFSACDVLPGMRDGIPSGEWTMNAYAAGKRFLGAGLALVLASAVLAPGIAAADNLVACVGDDTSLGLALINAEFIPSTIKLVQGSYNLHNTAWDPPAGSDFAIITDGSKLLGGYTAGCASRDIARGNTVLNDPGGTPWVIPHGNLTLEGLTFHASLYIDANVIGDEDFGGFPGTIDLPPDTELVIRRSVFSTGFTIDWGQDYDIGGLIRVVDTLFASDGNCDAYFAVIAGGEPDIQFVNNTLIGCSLSVYTHYNDGWGDGNPTVEVDNNILHDIGSADIDTNGGAFYLVDNMITHYSGPAPISQTGSIGGDPQLDANYRPIESPPSPVINSGSNDVYGGLPSSDLDGGARVVGSTVDRGAYESSINDAFIQPVTSAGDTGAGSLRAAILSANAHGSGLITFNIGSGCGPHVITLDSPLPQLIAGAIVNGYTQAGSSPNDLDVGDDAVICVILEAGNSNVTRGLVVPQNVPDGGAVSIRGMAFSGFSEAAIDLQSSNGHFVAGDHFGGNVGGHALLPNGIDIRLGMFEHGATIGSDDVADRNIIGDATGSGIVLQGFDDDPDPFGAHDNQILNNYIGVGWSVSGGNYTNRGNGARGIHLLGHDNTISGNLIGDNVQAGILVDGGGGVGNLIDNNFIGTDADGANLGNGNAGIHLTGNSNDSPHDNTIRYNTIAKNADEGVWVDFGVRNKVRKNKIHGNGLLGIDIAGEGITANDDDAMVNPFDYANGGQNFPVLSSAGGGSNSGRLIGTLTTTPGDYTLDVYSSGSCDASGYGEGATWLRSATVTVPTPPSGDQGTADFSIRVSVDSPAFFVTGEAITATATDADGDTSEFSACAAYFNDTIFANGFEHVPE
jgi:hypothetical protein